MPKLISHSLAVLAAFLLFLPVSLSAHPHVFITSSLDLFFESGRPTRLGVTWAFDDGFSAMVFEDYDTNKDGTFSEQEQNVLRGEVFDYLSEQHYFTFITHSGVKNHPVAIDSFRCEAKEGIVFYHFSIPLELLPGKKDTVRLSQYDPTNYSALFLSEDQPVTFSGDVPEGLAYTLRENTEESYYFGMLHPIEAVITVNGRETK